MPGLFNVRVADCAEVRIQTSGEHLHFRQAGRRWHAQEYDPIAHRWVRVPSVTPAALQRLIDGLDADASVTLTRK